jgi:hypothetical protein
MNPTRRLVPPALGAILLLAAPREARADRASEIAAQALYTKALALMKADRAEEACPLLVESQGLDPAMGTLYRLAECWEATGRFEPAWKLYLDAAKAAKKAGRLDREKQALEHAAALHARLPSLVSRVELAPTPAPAPVVAKAPPPPIAPPPNAAPAPSSGSPPSKGVVIAGTAAGVAALGVGAGFMAGSLAEAGKRDIALHGQPCGGAHAPSCSAEVRAAEHHRVMLANGAFWSFVAAGALGAGTLTYVLMAPSKSKSKVSASIAVGPGSAGATVVVPW